MTTVVYSFLDVSNEVASTSLRLADLAADGTNYAQLTARFNAIQVALEGVTGGVIKEKSLVASRQRLTNETPADGERESKWLVRYEDNVTKDVFNFEIPCAERTLLPMLVNSDFVDMAQDTTHPALTALVNAVENPLVLSPRGNAITVLSIEKVGRNT